MKLSMSMLSWYLREHNPVCHIEEDDLTIEGLRFVLDDAEHMQPEYLYFCNAASFFTSHQYADAYMIVNRQSTMLFLNSDYNLLLNRILSAFDFFTHLESRLLEAASAHASLNTFLQIMEPILENPFMISSMDGRFHLTTDYSGHTVDPIWAQTSGDYPVDHPSLYSPYYDCDGNRIVELSEKPVLVRNIYEGGAPVVMLYMKQNGENVGCISILQENPSLTAMNMQLAPIFARYCIHSAQFALVSGSLRAGTTMFRDLILDEVIGDENILRLTQLAPPAPWRLLQFRTLNRTDEIAKKALLSHIKTLPEFYLPFSDHECCYALISENTLQAKYSRSDYGFGLKEICASTSMPFSDLKSLPLRSQQAGFTWMQSRKTPGVHFCEAFAFDYLIRTFRSLELTGTLLHPALEVLKQYDSANQTELRKTLSVFLAQEQNQLLSAKALHIHPNTLRYRLQRICELTGLTLDQGEELNYLRLSDWLSDKESD